MTLSLLSEADQTAIRYHGRLIDPALLTMQLSQVEVKLATLSEADQTLVEPMVKYRVDALRGLGRLDEAMSEADKAHARFPSARWPVRLSAILSQTAQGPMEAEGPTRFLRFDNFLTDQEQALLWDEVATSLPTMEDSKVGTDGQCDPVQRKSHYVAGSPSLRDWFLGKIDQTIEQENILHRLGRGPFTVTGREIQLTRSGDSDFFIMHRDTGAEDIERPRTLTYVYYFHRLPRSFSGGDILFFDHDANDDLDPAFRFTRLHPVCNSVVFFLSDRLHAVSPVSGGSADPLDGRWTLNGWYHRNASDGWASAPWCEEAESRAVDQGAGTDASREPA